MNAAHTPAPWVIVLKTEPLDVDGFIVEGGNDHEIRPVGDAKLGDEMADLRLIAAAPDLLEALAWLRPFIRKDENGPGVVIQNADGVDVRDWLDRVDAVIAKAMGVQP